MLSRVTQKLNRIRLATLKLCQQKQKAGLEDSGGGVEWGDEGELTFQTVVDKRDWHSKQVHLDSSSSDEDDEDPRDVHMEVDTTDRTFLWVFFFFFFSSMKEILASSPQVEIVVESL